MIEIKHEDWVKEGEKRYGPDKMQWVFQCPMCKVHTKVHEWLDKKAEGMVIFSCIGRVSEKATKAFGGDGSQPCDYAGGGLFRMNPIKILKEDGDEDVFDFAEPLTKDEK